MLLARAGVETVVLEKQVAVGGRCRTLLAPGGYRFDLGPTFFLYPMILREIFAACGERLEDHVELKRLDPAYRLVFESGGVLDAAADMAGLKAAVARLAPGDACNLERFLADNRAKLELFRPVLARAFGRPADLLCPEMLRALPLHCRCFAPCARSTATSSAGSPTPASGSPSPSRPNISACRRSAARACLPS
jgi:phytoene desaturase